jgi:dTDP-4-amino-4,6-dideoxygalactose transaminase
MQAAIGRCQLDKWRAIRKRNAERRADGLDTVPGMRVVRPPAGLTHARYMYHFFLRPEALRSGWDRDRVLAEITARGVPCFTGSCPEIYKEKVFDLLDSRPRNPLPVARRLGETSLVVLVDPSRSAMQIERAVEVISAVMTGATR